MATMGTIHSIFRPSFAINCKRGVNNEARGGTSSHTGLVKMSVRNKQLTLIGWSLSKNSNHNKRNSFYFVVNVQKWMLDP